MNTETPILQDIETNFVPRSHENATDGGEQILNILTYLILPNRAQPRANFNGNNIIRLADSIKRYGMLQPLTVRKCFDGTQEYFELIAGERRLRAAKLIGMRTVPCVLVEADDKRSAELAIIENLLREDLNMFEQAQAFKRLIEEHSLTQEEVALRVSMSQSAVANKLRLLKLTENEQKMILESSLTERHARALLKITDPEQRESVLRHISASRMNVSLSEAYIDYIVQKSSENSAKTEGNGAKPYEIGKESAILSERPRKIDAFCSNIEKFVNNLRGKGTQTTMMREELDHETVITIRITK